MRYYARIALAVEASGVNEATEKLKALSEIESISDVEVEDGPDESELDESEVEEEEEET